MPKQHCNFKLIDFDTCLPKLVISYNICGTSIPQQQQTPGAKVKQGGPQGNLSFEKQREKKCDDVRHFVHTI